MEGDGQKKAAYFASNRSVIANGQTPAEHMHSVDGKNEDEHHEKHCNLHLGKENVISSKSCNDRAKTISQNLDNFRFIP